MGDDYPPPLSEQDMRIFRYTLIVVILAIAFAGYVSGGFRICTEVADSGAVLTVCNIPSVTDVPVVIGALAVLLLLLPDISEADFLGVLSLKRKVEAAEAEVEALRAQSTSTASVINVISHSLEEAQQKGDSPEAVLAIVEQVAREIEARYYPTRLANDLSPPPRMSIVDELLSIESNLVKRIRACVESKYGPESIQRGPRTEDAGPDMNLRVEGSLIGVEAKARASRRSIERVAERIMTPTSAASRYDGLIVVVADDAPDVSDLQGIYAVSYGSCADLRAAVDRIVEAGRRGVSSAMT